MVVWWGTEVECAFAMARREREGGVDPRITALRFDRLAELKTRWQEIQPAESVRRAALRLLRVHAVRAGDALQLAAAIQASEDDRSSLPFVCLDERLSRAAEREGFGVVVPGG